VAFCGFCGKEIADDAPACPNCGHPNELLLAVAAPASAAELAGFWLRFAGFLIDIIIVGAAGRLFGGTHIINRRSAGGASYGVFYEPFNGGLYFLYTWLMLGLNNGRTVGHMATRIRIAHPDKSEISLGAAAARQAMAFVSGLVFFLGYVWAAWDPENRTWHDMVARTRAFNAGEASRR
jgi:uncharacterized RDD family membrane protein YckC